jgi:predicted DNA-binding transcriptional regulator YafY
MTPQGSRPEIHSRPPWERIHRIHQLLQRGEYPNCSSVAREFEVTSRTIQRDMDFMKYRLELPIEYDARRYGFRYTRAVDSFPATSATEAEEFSMWVARKAVAQLGGTPFEAPLESVSRKLNGPGGEREAFSRAGTDALVSFRPFAPGSAAAGVFDVILTGLRERRVLGFTYRKLGAEREEARRIHPYHLACVDGHWYLFGHDVDRRAIRTFVLERLTAPRLFAERFERDPGFDVEDYLRGSFTVHRGGGDHEVEIEFDRWATDLVRGRTWHRSQAVTLDERGGSKMTLRLNSLREVERWVLSWGAHARVTKPRELAERVVAAAVALVGRYQPSRAGGDGSTGPVGGTKQGGRR